MNLRELVRKILEEDPRVGIVLAEILGPPPALEGPPHPREP
ncbi:MAG: hypothetical protein XD60_1774 [Acetothermia bacterium 64_32]|nr:MAG: hypothetical protein XD60_1774 [Acetothermia bacterium 64_32]